jgi:hypothetical protein
MRPRPPSPALVIASLALLLAAGGVSYATVKATGTAANIVDPTTASNIAKVDGSGHLFVSDGSGPMTVDGTVNVQAAPTSNYLHFSSGALDSGRGCVTIATPLSGKAMIVRQVRINVIADPSPGVGQVVELFRGASCNISLVGEVNPPTVGQTVVPFDPGLGIPSGSALSAIVVGSVRAAVWTDAYTVSAGSVPNTSDVGPAGGEPQG